MGDKLTLRFSRVLLAYAAEAHAGLFIGARLYRLGTFLPM